MNKLGARAVLAIKVFLEQQVVNGGTVSSLDLSNLNLQNDGVKQIAIGLSVNRNISQLNLSQNNMKAKTLDFLVNNAFLSQKSELNHVPSV